jgi:hypothetical protein
MFRSINTYPGLIDEVIPGNPRSKTDAQLEDAALPMLDRVYWQKLPSAIARLDELKPWRATTDVSFAAHAVTPERSPSCSSKSVRYANGCSPTRARRLRDSSRNGACALPKSTRGPAVGAPQRERDCLRLESPRHDAFRPLLSPAFGMLPSVYRRRACRPESRIVSRPLEGIPRSEIADLWSRRRS